MDLRVEVKGIPEFVRELQDLGVRRIPNYVARALTGVADRVQTKMIEETMGELTVRGTWIRPGTKYGINRRPATKSKLEAEVSSISPWLISQEHAETHLPRSGQNIVVPLRAVRESRKDPKIIQRKYTQMLRTRSHNLIKLTNEKGQTILYEHGLKVSRHFLPLFLIKHSTPRPRRVELEKHGQALVDRIAVRV